MLVTRETDYAIRTVLYLANDANRMTSVTEIAQATEVAKIFLAKLLQRLVKHGILISSRGAAGGFQLAKKPSAITLLDITVAMQGPAGINVCAIDSSRCSRSSFCSVHPVWVDVRKEVEKKLQKMTISRLMRKK